MNGVIHKIPYTSVLRERERIQGGIAEPGSDEAMAIARAVRDQLNNQTYMNDRSCKHRNPRIDPSRDQRTTPYGAPYRKEQQP